MSRRVIGASVLSVAACTSPAAFLDSAGLQSAIVWVDDGRTITAEAGALGEDLRIEREVADGDTVYVYGYAATLAELSLSAGPLASVIGAGDPIPEPTRRHALSDGEWLPLDAAPPALLDRRLPPSEVCLGFEWDLVEVPEIAREVPTLALPLDARRALLGTADGHFFVATSSSVQPVDLSTQTPSLLGARVGDALWLVGRDGRVVHGHPDRGFVDAPPLPFPLLYGAAMTASRGAAPLELFVADTELRLARFDGVAWQILRDGGAEVADRARLQLEWVGPGHIVATGFESLALHEFDVGGLDKRVPFQLPPRASADTLWNVRYIDGFGLVTGSRNQVIWLYEEGRWIELPAPSISTRPDVMLAMGDGSFIAGGEASVFVAWRPDRSSCEPTFAPVGASTRHITGIEGGFVALISGSDRPTAVMLGRRFR